MRSIYTRVPKIQNCPANEYYRDTRRLVAWVPNTQDQAEAGLQGLETLTNSETFSFALADTENRSLSFSLWETRPNMLEIARLTLPLSWFQLNTRVKDVYPMKAMVNGISSPMAEVEIHVSDTFDEPFAVPEGRLLVTPAWRPASEQSQAPLHPPEVKDAPFVETQYRKVNVDDEEYSYYYTDSDSEGGEPVMHKKRRISGRAAVPEIVEQRKTVKERLRGFFGLG